MAKAVKKTKKVAPLQENEIFHYKEGNFRKYLVTTPKTDAYGLVTISSTERIQFLALVVITLLVRFYRIDNPSTVVFDETNFGQSINNYILGEYFVDSDPPLVKLIWAKIAKAFGYVGDFSFSSIGLSYIDSVNDEMLVPYVVLRAFPAICGAATVILTYRTLRASGCRHFISLFGSSLLIFENSLITQSRYILLDAPLLFFISLAIAMYKSSELVAPYSRLWFKFLHFTGIAIGLAISSKTAGFFTLIWIGLLTLKKMWFQLGDLDLSVKDTFKQTSIKISLWIMFPLTIYLTVFAFHFSSLYKIGPGYHLMSPYFQAGLEGNNIENTVADVSYGSTVTIRHYKTGSYLHSHNYTYPGMTDQNQVTLYDFHDLNNYFFIEKRVKSNVGELVRKSQEIENGRQIRLFHNVTEKYIHVEEEKPKVSEQDYNKLVDAVGNATMLGDNFLNFEVRIQEDYSRTDLAKKRLRVADSVFQLYHPKHRCFLLAQDIRLPDWGFKQREVVCIEKPDFESSLWYIDFNEHPQFAEEKKETVDFKPLSFFEKLIETHQVMRTLYKNILNEHPYASKPSDWIVFPKGVNYSDKDNLLIYYFGNFSIYCAVAAACFGFIAFSVGKLLITNPKDILTEVKSQAYINFEYHTFDYVLGWIVHLLPFYFYKGQLFLHDYIPALYFGVLAVAQISEYLVYRFKFIGYLIVGLLAASVLSVFFRYTPFVYGLPWNRAACKDALFYLESKVVCNAYKQ